MDSEAIDAAAAEWVIRRDAREWTVADQKTLDSWLNESTLHRVAYLRLDAVWQQTARLQAVGAGIPAGIVPPRGSWSAPQARSTEIQSPAQTRSPKRWASLAAGLVALALASAYWVANLVQAADHYSTQVGGLRTVTLADGSVATLNTNTSLRAHLRGPERRIDLDSGEAYFVIAKDSSRPFVIRVANKKVTAVGTELSVRRVVADVQVLVTTGRVELSLSGKSTAPTTLRDGALARTANSEVMVQQLSKAEAEELLSWRGGFLIFHDISLADAVAEFNRYQLRKMVIDDPSIASIRIGGKFYTNNVEAFLSLLQQGFPVAVEESGGQIVLKRRS